MMRKFAGRAAWCSSVRSFVSVARVISASSASQGVRVSPPWSPHKTLTTAAWPAVAATMAGAISYAARMMLWGRNRRGNPLLMIAIAVAAPAAALMLRMMVSRTREYAADKRAAELTGDPEGLALALEGLSGGVKRQPLSTGSDATHYIVNGFAGGGVMSKLFSTHPPIEERAKRLRAMKL